MYGQRIKEIRQEKGLTQSQLAEMLSTTQSTVGKYEREEIQLTVDTIIKICKVFEVSADYLLGLEDWLLRAHYKRNTVKLPDF